MNGAVFLIHIANALPQKASHVEQREKCFPQVAFVFYPCHFSEKNPEETCYAGPGNNYFLGYGLWFSLATATGLLLLEICAADYKSQTAL